MQGSSDEHGKANDIGVTSPDVVNRIENASLVEKAADGDAEAFGELYTTYSNRIYQYVFCRVKDKTTAEDITEDTFVKAWKAIRSCKGKDHTFLPWLFRIAHNHLIDICRKRQKEQLADKAVEIETVADISDSRLDLEKRLEQQQLVSSIAYLPESQRQVIILKFIEGLDNDEIGRVMQRNQGAIRVLQMRALTSLRQRMKKEMMKTDLGKCALPQE